MAVDRTLGVQLSVQTFEMDKKLVELRVLGATELTGNIDGAGDGIVRQPKRLALLAYLAIATANGFRRRDEIIGLFWPELDQAQGRTYLRKALHALRDELGDDAFLTRGDDEVRVNPSVIWCDAAALTALMKAGRHREALDLYRGELLSGLYPEGVAQEFEEWLRVERKSLRHAAARAAWDCVHLEQARGDGAAATALARRALEIEPDNEEGVRELIALLDKRGDRAGALRVYKEWQSRLQEEFGVEPAPETRKLAKAVQAARKGESHETPAAPPVPVRKSFITGELSKPTSQTNDSRSRARSFIGWRTTAIFLAVVFIGAVLFARDRSAAAGPRSVAVLPLRPLGDPGLRHHADAIVEELTTRLAMDSAITVRSSVALTQTGSRRDVGKIGRDLGVAHIADGAVQRSGSHIRVTLRLVRASDAIAIWAGSYDTDDADVSSMAQKVAKDASFAIRSALVK